MGKKEIDDKFIAEGVHLEENTYATTHYEVRQGIRPLAESRAIRETWKKWRFLSRTHRLKWKSICFEKNFRPSIYTLFTGHYYCTKWRN